jgi:hypothetical protein
VKTIYGISARGLTRDAPKVFTTSRWLEPIRLYLRRAIGAIIQPGRPRTSYYNATEPAKSRISIGLTDTTLKPRPKSRIISRLWRTVLVLDGTSKRGIRLFRKFFHRASVGALAKVGRKVVVTAIVIQGFNSADVHNDLGGGPFHRTDLMRPFNP